MSWRYLDLGDFLLIAEAVLTTPADELARTARLDLAESALQAPAAEFGGVEFYPELAPKAAVLCSRIIRNHDLPDGNKRVATWPCWSSSPATTRRGLRHPTTTKATRPLRSSNR